MKCKLCKKEENDLYAFGGYCFLCYKNTFLTKGYKLYLKQQIEIDYSIKKLGL